MKIKKSPADHAFNAVTYMVMTFVLIVTLYPFWYVVVGSLSSMAHLIKNGFVLWPDGLHLDAYAQVFRNDLVPVAYRNTLIVTIGGTALSMLLTIMGGFVLSRVYDDVQRRPGAYLPGGEPAGHDRHPSGPVCTRRDQHLQHDPHA